MEERLLFRDVFEREFGFVYNSLRRLGVRDADLEDVTHEVFVVAHRHLGSFDAARPVRPWLFGIALRSSADYRRLARHRREVYGEQDDEPQMGGPGPEAALSSREELALVERALAQVDEDRRGVLILHDFEGQGMRDITDALSIPLRTGYSRLRVGREELAAALRRVGLIGRRP